MIPHPHSRSVRTAAIGLVLAFAVAACSDDNSDSSGTTAGPETTAAAPDTTGGVSGEPGFVFGYITPPAGLVTEMATAQQAAINLAIGDINDAGGVNGAPVSLITADQPLGGTASDAVNELLDKGANYILGPITSDDARNTLDVLNSRGSIACSASATAPDLTTLDTNNVFYRTAMPDTVTLNAAADNISERAAAANLPAGTKYKVSVLTRADDYGISVGNGLASSLTARGMQVQVIDYNPRRVEFSSDAATIAATNPDAVVLVAYAEAARQIDSLVKAGVSTDKMVGLDGLFNPSLGDRTFPSDPTLIDGLQVIGATGNRAFIDRLIADPATTQVIYGAQAYDCTIIGALAAAAAKSSDPVAYAPQLQGVTEDGQVCSNVSDCLNNLAAGDDIDYTGVSGGIRWDDQGDPTEVRMTTVGFKDGTMFEIKTVDVNLDDIRQQEALAAAVFTTRLQQLLTALGFYTGPIDGQWNDQLTAAVAALQTTLGVPVTGVWDAETDAAARAKYGAVVDTLNQSVMDLQQLLTDLGFYTGPIDGVYSAETVAAVKAFQKSLGVPETGVIDAATLAAAFQAGIVVGGTPPSTTVPPATTAPATTAPPVTQPPATTAPPVTAPPVTPPDPSQPTMLEALQADGRFTQLLALLTAAGYTSDTDVLGPITLFAPTDEAIGTVDQATLDAITADPSLLNAVLAYHLVDAELTLEFLATLTEVTTVHGQVLPVTVGADGVVSVGGVPTIAPAIDCSNGIIIPISGVLQPTAPA